MKTLRPWLIVGAAWLALAALQGYWLFEAHRQIEQHERERLSSQVRVIGANLARQLDAINHALVSIRKGIPRWNRPRGDLESAIHELQTISEAMPNVRTLLVMDERGTVLVADRRELIGKNFKQRDYFHVPQAQPNPDTLYVAPPFKSVLGVYSMSLVRAVIGPNGKFAGIVSATFDPEDFKLLLSSVRYSADMSAELVHADGKVFLTVSDAEPGSTQATDMARPGSFFLQHQASGRLTSVFAGLDPASGNESLSVLGSVHPAALAMNKPLVTVLSRDLAAVYAPWQAQLMQQLRIMAILALLLGGGLLFFQRRQRSHDRSLAEQIAQREASEADAATRLRESEERHRLAIQAINVGVMDIDVASGEMRCDDHWYEMLGFAPQAFPMSIEQWLWRMHPSDANTVRQRLDALLSSRDTQVLEFRFRDSHDAWRWISTRGRVVQWQGDQALRVIATHADMTERKAAAQALQNRERQVHTLMAAMQDLVILFDTAGTIVEYHSPAGRPAFFPAPENILQHSFADALPAPVAELVSAAMVRIFENNVAQHFDYALDIDGQPRQFSATLSAVMSDKRFPTGFLCVVRDLTAVPPAPTFKD